MFHKTCIYEAKLTKLDEIENLMKEVAEFYLKQDGVIDVHYIKRTHRQKDFHRVKEGELSIRLTRNIGKVTYVLYWVLENEKAHTRVWKLGIEKFYKRWNWCLTTMPKIILGENVKPFLKIAFWMVFYDKIKNHRRPFNMAREKKPGKQQLWIGGIHT